MNQSLRKQYNSFLFVPMALQTLVLISLLIRKFFLDWLCPVFVSFPVCRKVYPREKWTTLHFGIWCLWASFPYWKLLVFWRFLSLVLTTNILKRTPKLLTPAPRAGEMHTFRYYLQFHFLRGFSVCNLHAIQTCSTWLLKLLHSASIQIICGWGQWESQHTILTLNGLINCC